jgi:hypothetical protein
VLNVLSRFGMFDDRNERNVHHSLDTAITACIPPGLLSRQRGTRVLTDERGRCAAGRAGRAWRLTLLLTLIVRAAAARAEEAATASDEKVNWKGRGSLSAYFVPDGSDFLVAVGAADHGALHLEARYGYEDRRTASFFAGWNLAFGGAVEMEVVPMFGVAVGQTNGLVPALELTLSWGPLQYYLEAEVLIDLASVSSSYYYGWSELSAAPVEWMRAGIAIQRTRLVSTGREVSLGPLIGFSVWKIDLTAYWFDPGGSGQYVVVSAGVR